MKKKAPTRILSLALAAALLCSLPVFAQAAVSTGSAGGSTRWAYDSSARTLTFTGSGSTGDYRWSSSAAGKCTYMSVLMKSRTVAVKEGITRLGDSFLANGGNSISRVSLPQSLREIGPFAFMETRKLKSITIPAGVRKIDHGAFAQSGIADVYFEGTRAQWNAIDKAPNASFAPGVDGLKNAAIHFLGGTPYPGTPFTDINSHWGREAIKWAYGEKLFSGVSGTEFGPEGRMDRGMLVTVLHRLAGEPAPQSACAFTDVPKGRYYEKAVAWASENGIVSGEGGGRFGPDGKITREQAAKILYSYAVKYGKDVSIRPGALSGFSDQGKISSWAQEAMEWAVSHGVLNGSGGKLNPGGTASRAEVAQIFYNSRALLA